MQDVRLRWTWPTSRGGKPLPLTDIAHARIEISADGGVNYGQLAQVPATAPTASFIQTELEPGTWFFRVTVVDTQTPPAESPPAVASITLRYPAPDGIADLTIEAL